MYTYYVNTSPHSSLFPYLCVYVFVTDIHLCVYHYPQYIELFAQFCLFAQCNNPVIVLFTLLSRLCG